MEEKDEYIKSIWLEHFEMECAHLKLAIKLLNKHEKTSYEKVICDGDFPTLLTLGINKEYVRDVLERTVLLTGDRQGYIDVMRLKDNADFFLYQDEMIGSESDVPSHQVINEAIKTFGEDYRFEDSKNPVKELQSRKKDNTTLGRKNK